VRRFARRSQHDWARRAFEQREVDVTASLNDACQAIDAYARSVPGSMPRKRLVSGVSCASGWRVECIGQWFVQSIRN